MTQLEVPGIGQSQRQKLTGKAEKAHMSCMGTHVFFWGERAKDQGPPEGLKCKCGMFELHSALCECGCGLMSMSLRFTRGSQPGKGSKIPKSRNPATSILQKGSRKGANGV
jgi:hypothetical protein